MLVFLICGNVFALKQRSQIRLPANLPMLLPLVPHGWCNLWWGPNAELCLHLNCERICIVIYGLCHTLCQTTLKEWTTLYVCHIQCSSWHSTSNFLSGPNLQKWSSPAIIAQCWVLFVICPEIRLNWLRDMPQGPATVLVASITYKKRFRGDQTRPSCNGKITAVLSPTSPTKDTKFVRDFRDAFWDLLLRHWISRDSPRPFFYVVSVTMVNILW